MSFRKKLIVLLICLSIAPILALRAFGIHNVRLFAEEVVRQVHLNHQKSSEMHFNAIRQGHQRLLSQTIEQLETALLFQTYEARRLLKPEGGCPRYAPASNPGHPLPLVWSEAAADAPADLHQVYGRRDGDRAASARLSDAFQGLLPVYRAIEDHLGAVVIRHYTMIAHGVSVYPCKAQRCAAAQGDYGAWYSSAFEERLSYWSAPYIDPDSGRPAIALSLPLYCQEEDVFGVTSVVIDLERLIDLSMNPSSAEAGQFAFIGLLRPNPQAGPPVIQVFSQAGRTSDSGGPLETITAEDLGFHKDDDRYQAILNDFFRLRATMHEVHLKGRASYWAFSPIPHMGAGLVLVVPRQEAAELAGLLETIRERTRRVEIVTAVFLAVLVLVATMAALAFSRIVTTPLEKLTRAARKLAGGDLKARVAIDSRDEIGELGRVFNRIGPELSHAYAMRRSVELASKIQEHLLPRPPRVDGFDIFGLTLYSNLAGGDYYDFLCDEADQGRVCVAIGDVSGHGISSALLMASVRSALRMRARLSGTMSAIAQEANAVFSEDAEASGNFVTLFLARLDREAHRIQWVRAGHDPALLYDPADDTFTTLKGVGKGLPFGINKAEVYLEESHPFHPGQICFLGTDGLWEARDARGEFFGKKRIKQIIRENAAADAKMIATAVMDAVEAFQADNGRSDDFTCVVAKFTG